MERQADAGYAANPRNKNKAQPFISCYSSSTELNDSLVDTVFQIRSIVRSHEAMLMDKAELSRIIDEKFGPKLK